MPTRTFALDQGGPKRLTVSWKGNWKNLTLQLDARPLLTIPTSKDLKQGREVQLEAGTLKVQLKTGFFRTDLLLSLNRRPLPGSGGDPRRRLATAYGTIYFVGGLTTLLGLLTELFSDQSLKAAGFGWGSFVEGLIFLGLGLWVHKRHSLIGLSLAVGLFGLDAIVGFYLVASQSGGTTPNAGALIVRIFFLLSMSRGFGAIQDLRREQQGLTASPATL